MLETYSHSVTNTNKLKMVKIQLSLIGAPKKPTLLKSKLMFQQTRKSSSIINLITFTKTTEDMSNLDQTVNLEMRNLWVLKILRVIAIQFIWIIKLGRINNTLLPRWRLWTQKLLLIKLLKNLIISLQILYPLKLLLHVVSLPKVFSTTLFKLSTLQQKPIYLLIKVIQLYH